MEINWLLVSVLVVIAACVYHGYRVGLVRMVYSVATFLVAAVLVKFLAPVGVQLLKNNDHVYETIRTPIERMLDEKVDGKIKTEEVLDAYSVPASVRTNIMKAAEQTEMTDIDIFTPTMKGIAADYLALRVIELLAYIVLFLVINIGLRVLGVILDHLSKLPGIRGVNKLSGSLLGVAEGVSFVWICFIVMTIFSATAWGGWCFARIGESVVLSVLYAKNLFLIFL